MSNKEKWPRMKMQITTKINYDRLKKLSEKELNKLKGEWLKRLFENKYEQDKLYIDLQNEELKALIIIINEIKE